MRKKIHVTLAILKPRDCWKKWSHCISCPQRFFFVVEIHEIEDVSVLKLSLYSWVRNDSLLRRFTIRKLLSVEFTVAANCTDKTWSYLQSELPVDQHWRFSTYFRPFLPGDKRKENFEANNTSWKDVFAGPNIHSGKQWKGAEPNFSLHHGKWSQNSFVLFSHQKVITALLSPRNTPFGKCVTVFNIPGLSSRVIFLRKTKFTNFVCH